MRANRAMRVLICSSQVPFVWGGAEVLVEGLRRQLAACGHQVDVVQMPINWQKKGDLLKGYLAWRFLDLVAVEGQAVDLLIATKVPSFVVQHPHKVTWLIHQLRQVYDLYGTEFSPYGHHAEDQELRQIVRRADTQGLAESRKLFAISANVAARLARYNGLQAQVLYPPPLHDGRYHHQTYGDYILSVSRLNVMKRLDLLVEAMARVRSGARCLIAGEGPEEKNLQKLARKTGAGQRIEFLGYVDDDRVLSLYANALAVYYAPYDEDYGYATVEAMKSCKPVLTTVDSGGVLEFVRDRETGLVAPVDDPAALAAQSDELYANRRLVGHLGAAAAERVKDITWDAAIERLLAT